MTVPENNFAFILAIPVTLFSLCVHEYAHALVATWGGDDTPRLQHRLTLNPLSHIDWFGTILLPALAAYFHFPVIGWAKPVQVNPTKLKSEAWFVLVAIAGPLSNVLLAIIASLLLRLFLMGHWNDQVAFPIRMLLATFLIVNVALAIFNSLPIPPLDGSRVLFHFVINGRPKLYPLWEIVSRLGFFLLYLVILVPGAQRWLGLIITVPTRFLFKLAGI